MTHRSVRRWVAALVLLTACSQVSAVDPNVTRAPGPAPATTDPVLVKLPSAQLDQADGAVVTAALIDDDGQLGFVANGTVSDIWFKWSAMAAPDGSTAVLTIQPGAARTIFETRVTWLSLPDGSDLAELVIPGRQLELTATSLDGGFAGFSSFGDESDESTIAGGRITSPIVIASRTGGVVFEHTLQGNFVPEAFSRRLSANGVPAQVFLLEYFPAEAPRFYRVRVLSTETGEVSLPVNLRNKVEHVDERMAGFSRSQVVAHEQGLLFTLYRGTIDGTRDGEPYAFVHTLDFADGVWCLEVDSRLELDTLPGSLAVGGDRLYVASANGLVGSFPIPSITDPARSPSMDWVRATELRTTAAPVMTADDDGVYLGGDGVRQLLMLDSNGDPMPPIDLDGDVSALTWEADLLHAVGRDWATFGRFERPAWLGEIAAAFVD